VVGGGWWVVAVGSKVVVVAGRTSRLLERIGIRLLVGHSL
jgi:hypothetical protein